MGSCRGSCCAEAKQIADAFPRTLKNNLVYQFDDPAQPGVQLFESGIETLIRDKSQVQGACAMLSQHDVLGFDLEWNPSFTRGVSNGIAATLQLATHDTAIVFHIFHLHTNLKLPKALQDLLQNENITYVGNKISGDVSKLKKDYKVQVSKFMDVGQLFNAMHPIEARSHWSLQVRNALLIC